jgi:hypothetical protein
MPQVQRGNRALTAHDRPSRHRLVGLHSMDKRTREWRRLTDIVASLTAEISETGELSPVTAERVQRCAELCLLSAQARERALHGGGDLAAVARLENICARALRGLGMTRSQQTAKQPTLAQYLASRAGDAA